MDSLGRGALTLAIEAENLEMVELLIVMGVETKDALLHAINQEFVEAVELLLEHEELLRNIEIEAAGGNCKFERAAADTYIYSIILIRDVTIGYIYLPLSLLRLISFVVIGHLL